MVGSSSLSVFALCSWLASVLEVGALQPGYIDSPVGPRTSLPATCHGRASYASKAYNTNLCSLMRADDRQYGVAFGDVASFGLARTRSCQRRTMTALFNSRGGKSGDKTPSTQPKTSGWDSFKNAFYGGVDAVDSLASKVKGEKPPPPTTPTPVDKTPSPAQKLMQEYETRTESLDIGKGASLSNTPTTSQKLKPFDALKETVYSTVDASNQLLSKKSQEAPTSPALDRAVAPAVRTNLASDLRNPELTSVNPLVRLNAEQKLRDQQSRDRVSETKKKGDELKTNIYNAVDVVERTLGSVEKSIKSVPQKAEETKKAVLDLTDWAKTVPGQVNKAAKDITEIPSKVTQKAKKTKDDVETSIRTTKENVETSIRTTKETVESGIRTTKKVVEDVQDLPNKVVRSVDAAKKKVTDTKASVDETVTNVKVFVGLEKPKPKPPKVKPPEPPSAGKIALDVVGSIVKGGASFIWWAGRGSFAFAWDRVEEFLEGRPKQLAGSAGKPSIITPPPPPEAVASGAEKEPEKQHAAKAAATKMASKTKIEDDAEELQREVEDALRAAEESLSRAKEADESKK